MTKAIIRLKSDLSEEQIKEAYKIMCFVYMGKEHYTAQNSVSTEIAAKLVTKKLADVVRYETIMY